MIDEPDEERIALAGEYVLGLLEPEEEVEAVRADDPAFDRAITDWQRLLAELDTVPTPVTPEVWLWSGIEASIGKLAPAEAEPAADTAAVATPARPRAPSRRGGFAARRSRGLWRSLPFWRTATLAFACAAATFFVLSRQPPPPTAGEALAVTILNDEDDRAAWLLQAYADGPLELVPLVDTEVPANQALELWTLRDEQEGPISLGLIAPRGTQRREARRLGPPEDGQLFEITLERGSGSATGRPTGPILYKGFARPAVRDLAQEVNGDDE